MVLPVRSLPTSEPAKNDQMIAVESDEIKLHRMKLYANMDVSGKLNVAISNDGHLYN